MFDPRCEMLATSDDRLAAALDWISGPQGQGRSIHEQKAGLVWVRQEGVLPGLPHTSDTSFWKLQLFSYKMGIGNIHLKGLLRRLERM